MTDAERAKQTHDDPEQTLLMHLLAELKPGCCCAVCEVLREYCEETFNRDEGDDSLRIMDDSGR